MFFQSDDGIPHTDLCGTPAPKCSQFCAFFLPFSSFLMFLHLSVGLRGVPNGLWSKVHFLVSGPRSSLGGYPMVLVLSLAGYPYPNWGYPYSDQRVPLSWLGDTTVLGRTSDRTGATPPPPGRTSDKTGVPLPDGTLDRALDRRTSACYIAGTYISCGHVGGLSCFFGNFCKIIRWHLHLRRIFVLRRESKSARKLSPFLLNLFFVLNIFRVAVIQDFLAYLCWGRD